MRLLNDPNRLTEAPARFTVVVGKDYTIGLQYATGKLYPSTRPGLPDSVMYSLTNGQRAWFPVEVARLIDELHLAPGERFTICNHGARKGWEVRRAEPEQPQPEARFEPESHADTSSQPPSPAAVPVTKLEYALRTAISAAANAERYGAEINYPVRFDSDAIRAMAITLLINANAEGGRR